jgi:hypothetical protein
MQARIHQTCLFAVVALGLVVALAGTTLAQSSTPTNIGTWKLNLAKSTYAAGTAPKSSTLKIEVAGAGFKATIDAVTADGTVQHWAFTGTYDGKESAISGNSPYGDVVSGTRVDVNTTKNIYKKGGIVTTTLTAVVSRDGKTMTFTGTSKNAAGQTVNNVRVYDKQ